MQKNNMKTLTALALALMLFLTTPSITIAHSGRTDAYGGHKDNKNVSGLGPYHYHCGGHLAHLHPNGICPYKQTTSTSKTTVKKTNITSAQSDSAQKLTYKAAQKKLKELGYYKGEIDGSFGPKSKTALKDFQRAKGLEVDGKLGPKSKKALGIEK